MDALGYGYGSETLPPFNRLNEPSIGALMAARRPQSGFGRAGSELGSLVFGGGARAARGQQVFNNAATGEARLDDILLQARQRRDAEIGRQSAVQRAMDSGHPEIADMIRNSPNAASAGEAMLRGQELGWGDKAWETATAPTGGNPAALELLARMNAVRKPGNMQLTKEEGGVLVNPMLVPGDQGALTQTPESAALVGERNAAAGPQSAAAAAERALAAFRSGPQTQAEQALADQRTGKIGGGATKPLSAEEIKANFGDESGAINAADYNDFQRFQAEKGIADPHAALLQYRKLVYTDLPTARGAPPAPAAAAPGGIGAMVSNVLGGGAPRGTVNPADQKTATDAVRPASQAEFDALPAGTLFVNPADGRLMRKK